MTKCLLACIVAAAWLATTAFAAAPDSLDGKTYFEASIRFVIRTNAAHLRVLRADGTYREIFAAGTYGRVSLRPPLDGVWSYRRTGENTGELIFDREPARTLAFSSDDAGELGNGFFGNFSISDSAARPPLVNCSNRSYVRPGGTATAGFVLTAEMNRVLVRAIGPGLRSFGVSNTLAAPTLRVFDEERNRAENTGWSNDPGHESLRRAAEHVGAFPLSADSADSALIALLPAGAYTAQVSGSTATDEGEVLVEVYVLP